MALTDARLAEEYDAIRRRGFDHDAAAAAVVANHAETEAHGRVLADRLKAILARRIAPMCG